MLITRTPHKAFVRVLRPDEKDDQEAYNHLLSHFEDIVGKPPLTVVAVKSPKEQPIDLRTFLIARYCLERGFHGQTCLATDHQAIDADVFFERRVVNQREQYFVTENTHYHALSHGVLAFRHQLQEDDSHNGDRLFSDQDGNVMVFTGALPQQELFELIVELERDLEALWQGVVQGRILELLNIAAKH